MLQRQPRRPPLTPRDRTILVCWRVASAPGAKPCTSSSPTLCSPGIAKASAFWRHKSKVRTSQPRVPQDVITLIHSMARDNRLWGSKRIRDELQKVGYCLSKRTVAKYIRQVRPPPPRKTSQTWGSFLKNHRHQIWACDFLQTYDLWFRALFVSSSLNSGHVGRPFCGHTPPNRRLGCATTAGSYALRHPSSVLDPRQ